MSVGRGVAFNKLSVVKAPNQQPRLVVGSTISGVNPRVVIQEKAFNPGPADVSSCFNEQVCAREWVAVVADVSDTHTNAFA